MQATSETRSPRYRQGDSKRAKANAFFDRWRGAFVLILPVCTLIAGFTTWMVATKTELGYSQTTPYQRIEAVRLSVDTLRGDVDSLGRDMVRRYNEGASDRQSLRDQARPLLVQLCFTASDTVLALIRRDVNCDSIIAPRRR